MKRMLFLLFLVLFALSGSAAADGPTPLQGHDIRLDSVDAGLILGGELTMNQAIALFGQPRRWDRYLGAQGNVWHIRFNSAEVWINGDKPGRLERILFTKGGFTTARGIRIGDPLKKVIAAYGEADFETEPVLVVWHKYFIPNTLSRILFAIGPTGKVEKIGFANAAGGL